MKKYQKKKTEKLLLEIPEIKEEVEEGEDTQDEIVVESEEVVPKKTKNQHICRYRRFN
ncbi:MAG: hypothetical protein IPJ75_19405 [Ignavibacteriales bacterium]|nr:hypothetical protein [Ignavibacteriales bacterium]